MNNINIEKLELLSNSIKKLETSIDNTATWSQSNKDLRIEKNDIILLKDSRMKINRINNSFKAKPVFALFGASQVGKSYLIKNLLSINGKPLEILIGNETYDFLEKINPAGAGAESTGVVTRFTIENPHINTIYPIKAKLISISDLVIILTDCFLNDVELDEQLEYDDLEKHLENLENEYKESEYSQLMLNENSIFEIRNYFKSNFRKSILIPILDRSNYWNRIGKLISKIPSEKWLDIFSFYWINNKELNNLFKILNTDLEKLEFNECIFLNSSSILRDGGEILDVTRVKEIYDKNSSEQTVYCNDKEININTNRLSALISEITLNISKDLKDKKEFLKNTDLLDFPGARSRLKLSKITNEETPLMYLRGKISYLFKRYSSNLEINNLLFCINDQQNNVTELPKLLNEWITDNIGENIDHRSNTLSNLEANPLSIIFTFFNNQLTYDSINDSEDLNYKWDNRFSKFFKDEIITTSHNWDTQWSTKENIFKNFYMLRDYKYSSDVFNGFDNEGTEKSINKNRIEYLEKLKNSFINYSFVKKHFNDPTKSWDAASSINNDGSELMIKDLLPSANNLVKINNSIKKCNIIKTNILDCLAKYHVSDDRDVERNKIKKNCLNTSLSLSRYISNQPHKYSVFIESLQLKESDVYNIFHENINYSTNEVSFSFKELLSNLYPHLSDNNTLDENIEIIRKHDGLDSKEDVIETLKSNGIDLSQFKKQETENELDSIINKIMSFWQDKVKSNKCKIDDELLNQILEDLLKTMNSSNLTQKIQDELSPKFYRVKINREDEIYFTTITTSLINEFVTYFGTKNLDKDTLLKMESVLSKNEQSLYMKCEELRSKPNEKELNDIFDEGMLKSNNFTIYLLNFEEWKLRRKIALLNNCGYVDNEQNNKNIKELILSIDNLQLDID